MITEAIILAGGLGTRLQSVVHDVPKCLALVNYVPFLAYVLDYADGQGIEHIILSIGYKGALIKQYVNAQDYDFEVTYITEAEPLGTGGAIVHSMQAATTDQVLILNGDTLFEYNLTKLFQVQEYGFGHATLCLKPMSNFDRYGAVISNNMGKIKAFNEKQYVPQGLINTGVYAFDRQRLLQEKLPKKFSIEKDYFEKNIHTHNLLASIQDAYFIDIGIPEDYAKAQTELKDKLC